MALTDMWLKANSGKSQPAASEKADRDGLSIRLSPKGKITFQMRYRYAGKAKRLDLGTYPYLSLKEARAETVRLRGKLEQGMDPKVIKQLERAAIMKADSLKELFYQWYETDCRHHKASHDEVRRSFETHVFPEIGDLPAKDITLHVWLGLLEKKAKYIPAIASRLLTNAKQMYKWGVKRQLLESNPLADITARADLRVKKNIGKRSLNHEEVRLVWTALKHCAMSEKNKNFVRLNLIFGCRNGELRLSEKSHFDFDKMIWTVPPENHKMGHSTGKPLLRPILPEVKPILELVMKLSPGRFMFTNLRDERGVDRPMGANAQLPLPYGIRQWLRRKEGYEMEHWSIHDLRKTVRTNLSELTEPHIAEIILGHKLPGQWQVYDHYDYLKEQREAYSRWWARLMKIVGE